MKCRANHLSSPLDFCVRGAVIICRTDWSNFKERNYERAPDSLTDLIYKAGFPIVAERGSSFLLFDERSRALSETHYGGIVL